MSAFKQLKPIFSQAGHQIGVTDDTDPSLCCLCLPGAEPPGRKQSRHPTSGIIDSSGPIWTLQLFPSFSFCLIVRCVIATGGATYCYTVI